jgi:anhydro-N-acetylmuramic acid kinase
VPAALHLGLISGTSADGIDAALVRFDDRAAGANAAELLAARTYAYPAALRSQLLDHSQGDALLSLDALGELDHRIGSAFADAAAALLANAGIDASELAAIGSHGQTLRHRPSGPAPFTLQLGDPSLLAERLGVTVVADFRRRDVAAGGQGAPLAPAFHAAVLRSADEDRAVLNLGGIANLSLLPREGAVIGFDSGPANGLMDAWVQRELGRPYDADGAFAASGRCDETLLARLLDEPYFALPAPKSSGRDHFHLGWLEARLAGLTLAPQDVQATLLELTAQSCADALRSALPGAARLLVCGGGVHNRHLMARLAELLTPIQVQSSAAFAIDPDFMEAMAFAWLARETLAGRPGNLPSVTGARGPRVLGAVFPP